MSNILIVTSEFKFTGPNNVILSLCAGWKGHSITVCALRSIFDQNYINKLRLIGCNVVIPDCKDNLVFFLRNVIKKTEPDFINTHGIRADLLVFLLTYIFNVKQFSTIHNVPTEDYFSRYHKMVATCMLFFHKIIFRSQRVKKICVSKNVMKNLSLLGGNNLCFVYNGIDLQLFPSRLDNRRRELLASKLNLPADRIRVVFCGQLTPLKDPIILAEAAKHYPAVDFLFLGDGVLKSIMIEKYKKNKNVHICGLVSNVSEYFSVSDVYVMPSLSEGMPMALIEAMFSEMKIITSDIPIFDEISCIDGISLLMFKRKNLTSLLSAIDLSLNSDAIIKSNRVAAIKNFSSESMANNYYSEFKGK